MKRKTTLAISGVLVLLPGAVYVRSCNRLHARHGEAWTFAVSPREDRLVFAGVGQGEQDLFALDLAKRKVTRLTNSPDLESFPAFSPDGKHVVYASGNGERADHIFTRSLDGKTVLQLSNDDFNDHEPTFSPDGKHVVFVRDSEYISGGMSEWGSWRGSQLYTVNTDGTGLRQVTTGYFEHISAPRFSPDGKEIVFSLMQTHGSQIGKVAFDEDQPKPPIFLTLASNQVPEKPDTSPAFLADNLRIIFFSNQSNSSDSYLHNDLFLMNRDGSNARKIASHVDAINPVLSSDGKHITFVLYPQYSLWRMDWNGRNRIKIATSGLFKQPLQQKAKTGSSFRPTPKR